MACRDWTGGITDVAQLVAGMVRVSRVLEGSVAEELGIQAGTELLTVNGREVADFLDWEFLSADDELVIEARLPSSEDIVFEIERPDGESLGVELEPPDRPPLREPVRVLLHRGAAQGPAEEPLRPRRRLPPVVRLRKLRDAVEPEGAGLQRILEYRLSPLYISVHATPWEARKVLLNNPRVPNIVEQLTRLAAGGIQFHGQMVIVPGLNDGDVLEQSLTDLWNLGDAVLSVALVPVGLTQFSHLYTGQPMDRASAKALLDTAERWGAKARVERGETWVYGSDELYLLAGEPLHEPEFYGDFSQVENGVGAVSLLRERVASGLESLPRMDGKRIGVVTGLSMAALMPDLIEQLTRATGAAFEIIPTMNSMFGPTTTCAGLLVGADIRRALEGRGDLDLALIPAETMNDNMIFLDDDTFAAVRAALPMTVLPSYDFIDVLANRSPRALGRSPTR